MRLRTFPPLFLTLALVAPTPSALAADQWTSDIQANPARYWNTTVTVTGQVTTVTANPAGTTRGTYTLLDDSSPMPLIVRTKDLPPVGRSYVVTGVVIQDPLQAGVPILNELERSEPGMSAALKYGLIAAGALLLALLVVLVAMMLKPKDRPAPMPTQAATPATSSASTPTPPPASFDKTRRIESKPAAAAPDKTKVFLNLGSEIVVDRGPDQGSKFPLHKQVTSIGRAGARKNDIELSDDTVSKEQASIYHDSANKRFSLTNESSTNPTTVDKKMITESTVLEPDSVIEMGSTALRFRKL